MKALGKNNIRIKHNLSVIFWQTIHTSQTEKMMAINRRYIRYITIKELLTKAGPVPEPVPKNVPEIPLRKCEFQQFLNLMLHILVVL